MNTLSLWTVYDHPTDYPDSYVARRFEVPGGPTDDVLETETLEALRAEFERRGLVCLPRASGDDPRIIETWL